MDTITQTDILVFPDKDRAMTIARKVQTQIHYALGPLIKLNAKYRPVTYPQSDGTVRIAAHCWWIDVRPDDDPEPLVARFLRDHGPAIEKQYGQELVWLGPLPFVDLEGGF